MTFWDNIVSQIEDISNYAVRYKVRHSFRSICEVLCYVNIKKKTYRRHLAVQNFDVEEDENDYLCEKCCEDDSIWWKSEIS